MFDRPPIEADGSEKYSYIFSLQLSLQLHQDNALALLIVDMPNIFQIVDALALAPASLVRQERSSGSELAGLIQLGNNR